jgi:hypothetical protein
MNKHIAKVVLGAILATPMLAGALTVTSIDTYTIKVKNTGLFNVSIDATWADLVLGRGKNRTEVDASELGWILTGPGTFAAQIGDWKGLDSQASKGKETINLFGLTQGDYLLTLSGTWDASLSDFARRDGGSNQVGGTVDLLDGDRIHGDREKYTVRFFSVSAVPEPESYAMLLAGMGLMASVAYARRKSVRI